MRTARLTWLGAFHHVMNRGLNKQKIFLEDKMKKKYIELMAEKSEKYKIKIFAYCIMNNHFHIALQNSSGNLSDFMKSLNGQYGRYYRNITNSKGYVFEDRFKSTIIQDDKYLITLIMYILFNPVRSGYVKNAFNYKWSSINEYFQNTEKSFVDKNIVEDTFISRDSFLTSLINTDNLNLNELNSNCGKILGDENFKTRVEIFNKNQVNKLEKEKKINEIIDSITKEFEIEIGMKISMINTEVMEGKRLRREFLIKLKKNSILSYRDILKISLFENLKYNTIRTIYAREIKRRG